jgi:predicted ATPase
MKIIKAEVLGLLNRYEHVSLEFHDDLNIITGRNGAGKTSLLKLLWYVISGNILLALKEVPFKKLSVETNIYTCIITRTGVAHCKVEFRKDGAVHLFEDDDDLDDDFGVASAEDKVAKFLISSGSSVFFPTFRRIEGGFSIEKNRPTNALRALGKAKSEIEEALLGLSRRLTNETHVFVSSISTVDITSLLMRNHADFSEIYNDIQQKTSQEVINTIKEFKRDVNDADLKNATDLLDDIRLRIEDMEKQREKIMRPFDIVKSVVEELFSNTGIKIGTRFNFGDAANSVNSDELSAGEKQMLSFICYNAFYQDSIIFIDEPELSLHVDWQRQIFSVLQKQQTTNQFIIATHSPFIYSKYPDKEIAIDMDRGNGDDL